MTKEQFVKIIKRLKEAYNLQTKIETLFRKSRDNIACDFQNAGALQINHEGIVVDLLEEIMEDCGGWISYWLYELNYGLKYVDGCVTDDGKNIDISTVEKLYSFLVKERERRNETHTF